MAKTLASQIADIKRESNQMAAALAKDVAETARRDLARAQEKIIDNYYEKYEPTSYRRKYGLYRTLLERDKKVHGGNKTYVASIEVGSEDLDDHYGSKSRPDIGPDNIFDLVWNDGIRGLPDHGDVTGWINPYYGDAYGSNCKLPLEYEGVSVGADTPDAVLTEFKNIWGETRGKEACDKAFNKVKSRFG